VATLLRLHREQDAVAYAEQATRLAPRSADSFFLLGQAYFLSDRTQDAIRAFRQSVKLRPDATVQQWLDRAERESSAENNFTEADTGHFALHYEGGKSSDALRGEILSTLEAHYNELVSEIGVAPRSTISVSLYTSQAFFDVTQAPGWSGAVYDGKLRIPVEGLTSVTPELSRVLKHELAHAFISQITRGRCPQWLNEGVAMSVEPRSLGSVGYRLEQVYAAQRQMPLSALEGSWLSFSSGEASLAYYEGLAGVLYIRDTYGMSDVQRILQRIGDGSSTEAAMRMTIHGGYADLEEGITGYLKKNFGP
jgi:tetratricopeptide (TPR) repeat protein